MHELVWYQTRLRVKLNFLALFKKFVAFAIRSAGWMIDFDTEVILYTEMDFWPGEPGERGTEHSPPKSPTRTRPEESCL